MIRDLYSDFTTMEMGVPRGSILSPLLFIIYLNNLPADIKTPVMLYADDTSVLCKGTNFKELLRAMKNTRLRWQVGLK